MNYDIPEELRRQAAELVRYNRDYGSAGDAVLEIVTPILIAATLRQLALLMVDEHDAVLLRARADELDPRGGAA